MSTQNLPRIPLPKSWNKHVRASLLHVISLAQFAVACTRGWAANSINPRLWEKSELERLTGIVALLREEIRIKDARMGRISPHRRLQYQPVERMAILELRAAQGWSSRQTAKTFLVTDTTIGSWLKRIDEEGPDALLQLLEPVNRFPAFVRYAVQRLKILCPSPDFSHISSRAMVSACLARKTSNLTGGVLFIRRGRIVQSDAARQGLGRRIADGCEKCGLV